ncbi:MAG: hypothetical protein HY905_18880 [Deltaproteobacteria bacterium]|nr:hypothetical protein [Deltaproteobacteria bacterium]
MKNLAWIILLGLAPAGALADGPAAHGGVPLDTLTPSGMQRLSIEAPAAAGRPVGLTFGEAGTPEVRMEVFIGRDGAEARAVLEDWRRTLVRPPPEAELGDGGYGEGPLWGWVRDNVFVAVQRVAGEADAEAIAARVDEAVKAAPAGAATAAVIPERVLDDAQLGDDPLPLPLPSGLVAARVQVCGPGYARSTRDGWVLVRTDPGVVTVRVLGVDDRLRVTRGDG